MTEYCVPTGPGEAELVEKRSRFLGHLRPAETEEEARAFLAEMKKKYYDARHNCWCYILGGNIVRYSDDGEPQGTAGQPMLKVFERENVQNVCCVVTRYFGGILLGAGGLTRAYSRGARDALEAAGVAELGSWCRLKVPCSYPLFEQVRLEIIAAGGTVDGAVYGASVEITASVPAAAAENLGARLKELSAGVIVPQELSREFRPGPRREI